MVGQVEQMMQGWLKHRKVLEELLKTVPDEHTNFKPWDGAMGLSELAQHIAASADMFVSIVQTGEGQIMKTENVNCETMAEVRQIVRDYTAKTKATYETITDAELDIEYDSPHPNFRGPRKKILTLVTDHEIHHKGQLFVYARLVGVKELPFFV